MADLTNQEIKVLQYIRNYASHVGHPPSIRKLTTYLNYKSTQSVNLILKSLILKGYLDKDEKGKYYITKGIPVEEENLQTVNVPIVGRVAAGEPIFAEENIEGIISVSTTLARPPYKYFILRVRGDSLNLKKIFDRSLVLIRQQNTANNGDLICAVIDNQATIKEYIRKDNFVILKPHSTNKTNKPILLTENFQIQGIVVATIPEFESLIQGD